MAIVLNTFKSARVLEGMSPLGMSIGGRHLSRLVSQRTQQDQTRVVSYYMKGEHERAVHLDWFSSASTFMIERIQGVESSSSAAV